MLYCFTLWRIEGIEIYRKIQKRLLIIKLQRQTQLIILSLALKRGKNTIHQS